MNYSKQIQNYALFFENLNKDISFFEYKNIFSDDVYFEDPFQKTKGIQAIYNIFNEMYKTIDEPRFLVKEIIQNDDIAYLQWNFMFKYKNSKNMESFTGVSRVQLDSQGKVISHIDYWDAASNIYEKIPVLKSILRFIKNKIKA
ncbi:nuclear transport factor 2 family protein [Arcobacter sp. YIC-80]|uniref:nuclear transport factor 2 family protein n=1 Tax=unclassified Arcobacter TaxID=2593671 RepID=UPI00384EB2BF